MFCEIFVESQFTVVRRSFVVHGNIPYQPSMIKSRITSHRTVLERKNRTPFDVDNYLWRMVGRTMSMNPDCKCGHKFAEHRQLEIINYCIGDDFLCKCEKYDGKDDL
ncbi:MAG: hypothetical protein WBF33_28070 [Candidatus Nitrosopolaris sp.]